jgi:hypothetical protein
LGFYLALEAFKEFVAPGLVRAAVGRSAPRFAGR